MEPLDASTLQTEQVMEVPDKYLVSVEDVERSLMEVKVSKAPGPDGIPNWLLRDYAGIVGAPLASIWNNTMRQGVLPLEWKSAEVIPLAKVTPPESVENDARPVSLTPTAVKLQESFIYKWVWDIVKDKINHNQYGCVKKSSTTMALVDLFDAWARETDVLKTTVRILMIDYRKAFDLIDHNIVLRKLLNYGVPPVLLSWISAFLENRLQCVRIGKERSGWLELNGGVPQGTKLGPLLYIIMINDLELDLPLVKFMDDSTTYEVIHHKNSKAVSDMNQQGLAVSLWSKENNTQLNTKKTKEMQICFSKVPPKLEPVVIDNTEIELVSEAKLLGVWIKNDLTWSTHIDEIHRKACKRIFFIVMMRRAGYSQSEMVGAYESLIRSLLEYAAPVWHAGLTKEQCRLLESVQKRVLKIIYPGCDYDDALKKSELQILSVRRTDLCKKLFRDMQNSDHKLNHLLPKCKDRAPLRKQNKYEPPKVRTVRYKKTFIPFCLYDLQ